MRNIWWSMMLLGITSARAVEEVIGWVNIDAVINQAQEYLPEAPVILEAGAYKGDETFKFSRRLPKAQIHAFEPVPPLYALLKKKIFGASRVHTYPCALSDHTGTATMYISSEGADATAFPTQSSSLMVPKEHLVRSPATIFSTGITVPTVTIDAWADEHHIDHVDFMWLDLQGHELQVLKAAPRILKTVRVILTEVEFIEAYKDQYLFEDIKQWLENEGFVLVKIFRDDWYGDALFIRRELLGQHVASCEGR